MTPNDKLHEEGCKADNDSIPVNILSTTGMESVSDISSDLFSSPENINF